MSSTGQCPFRSTWLLLTSLGSFHFRQQINTKAGPKTITHLFILITIQYHLENQIICQYGGRRTVLPVYTFLNLLRTWGDIKTPNYIIVKSIYLDILQQTFLTIKKFIYTLKILKSRVVIRWWPRLPSIVMVAWKTHLQTEIKSRACSILTNQIISRQTGVDEHDMDL